MRLGAITPPSPKGVVRLGRRDEPAVGLGGALLGVALVLMLLWAGPAQAVDRSTVAGTTEAAATKVQASAQGEPCPPNCPTAVPTSELCPPKCPAAAPTSNLCPPNCPTAVPTSELCPPKCPTSVPASDKCPPKCSTGPPADASNTPPAGSPPAGAPPPGAPPASGAVTPFETAEKPAEADRTGWIGQPLLWVAVAVAVLGGSGGCAWALRRRSTSS